MNKLTPRQRLLAALRHEEPDAVPYDLASTSVTGMHTIAYKNLLQHLDREDLLAGENDDVFYYERVQGLGKIADEVKDMLLVDTRGARFGNPSTWQLEVKQRDGRRLFVDELGCIWISSEDGLYFDQRPGESHPLTGPITVEDIKHYRWPNPADPGRFQGLRRTLSSLQAAGYPAILEAPFNGIFATSFRMRGYVDFYQDLAINPRLACAMMDRITDLKIGIWEAAREHIADTVDVLVELDDLGGQDGLLISPQMYRQLVKPRHQRLFSFLKQNFPHAHIMLHSDGSVYDVIPDLIEMGVDILNPIQVSAGNMDSAKLKREFGDNLCFWGGAADPQNVLGKCSPAQVQDEVKRRIDDLAPGGGYVFASIHNVQSDVSPENFMALWHTLQQRKHY